MPPNRVCSCQAKLRKRLRRFGYSSLAAETYPLAERERAQRGDSMTDNPETFETTYGTRPEVHWEPPIGAALKQVTSIPRPKTYSRRRRRMIGLALGASVVALGALAALWPTPSDAIPVARAWDIKVSSGGTHSVVAFVYGKEAGLQLVRIPPKGASRLIPARLGEAPVLMVSLGWSEIVATGDAPPGERPMSWSASGRVVQAYSNNRGTGVRVW